MRNSFLTWLGQDIKLTINALSVKRLVETEEWEHDNIVLVYFGGSRWWGGVIFSRMKKIKIPVYLIMIIKIGGLSSFYLFIVRLENFLFH